MSWDVDPNGPSDANYKALMVNVWKSRMSLQNVPKIWVGHCILNVRQVSYMLSQ